MSLNRTLAGIINASGELTSGGGLDVYATLDDLPTSGLTSGDQAFVSSTSRFYISNGSGWYNVALINATPSLSISPEGTIELANDGSTTTITLTATDSDYPDAALTFSVESDGNFGGLATLSQDSSVFTITPLSEDSATTTSSTLTFKASDGISFGSGTSVLSLSFKVANSNYTTLLAKADTAGTDNQVDASTSAHTITENGNVTSTAFTPYHPGGYSAEFVSGINYLYVDNDVSSVQWMYNGSTAEGTFEAWIYQTAQGTGSVAYTFPCILGNGPTYFNFGVNNAQLTFYQWQGSQVYITPTGATISLNTWHHVAFSNDASNNFRIFLDGALVHTISSWPGVTWAATSKSDEIYIGIEGANGATSSFTGFIRDARMIQGTALYTSTFTPPTQPLTAITNTEWLFCHAPYIKDGSTNNVVISDNYGVSTSRFGPYEYLGYNRTDHGGSVHFDGSGDYLVPAITTAVGTSDFTLEGWFYLTSTSSDTTIFDFRSSGNWGIFSIVANNTVVYYNGSSTVGTTSNTVTDNTWNHIAIVRNSGSVKIYINGVLGSTTADTTSWTLAASPRIGANKGNVNYMNGYISDVRFISGTAAYTADFTPPTAPLTAITNTQLLTCTNKNDIWDAATGTQLTKTGDATSSNAQRKFVTSSAMAFDGTGDYIEIGNLEDLQFGTGDFTIEGWIYKSGQGANGYDAMVGIGQTVSATTGWYLEVSSDRGIFFVINNTNISYGTWTNDSAWHHIAVTRSSGTVNIWLDGSSVASGSLTTSVPTNGTTAKIGSYYNGTINYTFNGYMQDVRITNGLARYTTSFTPPTTEFSG